MNPTPIVQLITYQNEQLIEPEEHQYPPCILHASLWSEDQTHPLDIVYIMHNKKIPTTPVRTMMGTLSNVPLLLYDQQHRLGAYFSFPDIGVRVANTYCLKFDLVFLTNSSFSNSGGSCPSVAPVYSDPFIVYSSKSFPGIKESSNLTKHLALQGLKVSIKSNPKIY
ncbi:velvet factor [Absidia repens]|uniref:Velvet factor n=1 Tax=Absidia repens TaxID=90262 RepID=A0A1X2IJW8_9FUNG|nr:velvet factor [Absidia repens]